MRGFAAVAAIFHLTVAAPGAATATDGSGGGPLWRVASSGRLLGVAGSTVVLELIGKNGTQELLTIDARTGRERAVLGRWRAALGGKNVQLGNPFVLGPLLGGTLYPSYAGLALVDPWNDRLRLRLHRRELAYMTTLPGATHAPIAVADASGLAILGATLGECGVELRGVDLQSGRRRWRWAPDRKCAAVFATTGAGRAILYSEGKLRALDLRSGRISWQRPSPICEGELCDGLSDFAIAADHEHVAMTVAGRLAVHSASTGALLSRADLGMDLPEGLLVSAGYIYVASKASLVCLNPAGHEVWRFALGEKPTDVGVSGDTLYVAALGVVRAFDRATGAVRWAFGGDRFAIASPPGGPDTLEEVIIGEDGDGAAAYAAGRPPGPARDVVVRGRVTMRGGSAGMPARVQDIHLFVGGAAAHPTADGKYEARVRLSGGRIAISASGCTGHLGPIHLRLDERAEYRQDLELQDYCGD